MISGSPDSRVRMLGTEQWRSGTAKEVDFQNQRIRLDLERTLELEGRLEWVSLDKQPVHIAEDFVWAIEPADTIGLAAASGNALTPALLFKPFGPPERDVRGPKHAPDVTGVGAGTLAVSGRVAEGEFLQVLVAEPADPSQLSG